jgi:hypothetical protein
LLTNKLSGGAHADGKTEKGTEVLACHKTCEKQAGDITLKMGV